MSRQFEQGTFVRHFKREMKDPDSVEGLYRIMGYAHHTETGEVFVLYHPVSLRRICARPMKMFYSEVDREKYPDIKQKYRFELATPSDLHTINTFISQNGIGNML